MSCQRADSWADAYLDGELDLIRSLEFEEHLKDCAECRAAYGGRDALRQMIQNHALPFEAPPGLDHRIRARLQEHKGAGAEKSSKILPGRRALALVGSIAALLILSAISFQLLRPSPEEPLAEQVVSSHIRSLMANHLTDVASSDQHTVKPWFAGKLDFAPVVKDLKAEGFPLTGGRLDYLNGRPVAALLYCRRQHTINLFVWPGTESTRTPRTLAIRGYNVVHWTRSGMTYWAVSDLNARELIDFARRLQE